MEKKNKEIIKAETKEVVKEKKRVNLPNILTVARICLVPVFVVLMALNNVWEYMKYVSLGIFVLAAITDFLDGIIARKKKIVTRFGKLMDPLADKILVASGFIMLTGVGVIPAWVSVIVVARDFLLNTLRMFGTEAGETIAAGVTGKIKTAFQMLTVVFGILDTQEMFAFIKIGNAMSLDMLLLNVGFSLSLVFAVLFTVLSCIGYFAKYRKYIDITE